MLSPKMFGKPVMPPQPDGIWRSTYNQMKWVTSEGEDAHRRAIYTFWKRTSPYPSMLVFDSETREVCSPRRIRTNTPLRALVLMNDPVYLQAAGGLAEQMLGDGTGSPKSWIDRGFRRLLIRAPSASETSNLIELFTDAATRFAVDSQAATAVLRAAKIDDTDSNELAQTAAAVVTASVLLNLDETIRVN